MDGSPGHRLGCWRWHMHRGQHADCFRLADDM